MRKHFLVVEMTQFELAEPVRNDELVEVEPRQNRRPDGFAPAPRIEGGRDRVARELREIRAAQRRPDGMERGDPDRFLRYEEVDVTQCWSMADAEEYVSEVLGRFPQYKFVIFESVSFLETVSTPPVKKRWDNNGQLRDVG